MTHDFVILTHGLVILTHGLVILTHGLLFALALLVGPPYVVDYRLEADKGLLDRTVYYSAPDSLRLDASDGNGYRCLPVRQLKPGVRYRLSFHYLVAAGSEGTFGVYANLYDRRVHGWSLVTVGRWKRVDIDIEIGPDMTDAAIVFECEATGQSGLFRAWVDDVVFRPVGAAITTGP